MRSVMSLLVCVCLLASVALVTANGPTCVGGTCVQKLEMMHRPAQVYVCGDATLTDTSIGGGLIVKGDANLIDVDVSAEIDEDLTGLRYDLIVGGDLSISCAHVAGNIKHGGAYDATAVTIKSIHSTSHGSIIDFNMASMAWMAYSATLSTVTSSTSTSMSGNQLLVTGSGATATYAGVTVSGSSGFSAVCFSSVDAGDGIIINIQVDSAGFAFGATEECSSGSKGDASKVIYNFHGAAGATISVHGNVHGSIIAPSMTLVQDDKTEVDGQIIVENYVSDGGSVSAKAFSGNSNLHDCNTHTCPALNLGLAKSDQCKEPFSMTAVDSCCPHIECTDCAWIPCMMIDCPGDAYEFSITPVPGECCDDVQCVLRADTQPPSMTNCPANIAVTGTQGTPVSWMEPSFSDNIAVKAVTKTHEPYHEFCEGTTTVSYTATDYQDNERVCTFKVTVVDNSPPVIVWEPAVLANGTRTCDQLPIQWPSVSAVSNKGGFPSVQFSSESFTSGKTHTFIGVWTNTHAQPQAVAYTVVDNTPPTFNGVWPQPSSDLVTELEANTFINSLSGLLGFEDPCSGMGSISIQSSVNTDDIIVVARAEDSVGNVQEVQHTYSRGSADDDNDGGVGGQTDADGCIIGTGYTWCDAANDCIPQWEQSCDTTCLQHRDQSQNTVTNIAGKLVFNGAAYSQYDSIAVTQGEYEFTNIPASNPLGFVVSGGAIDVLEGTVDGEPVSQSGSLIQHYSGYLKIRVNYDFTSGGIRGRYAGYSAGGENTLVYDGSCPASTTVTPATVEKTNVCLQGMADGVNEITVVNGKYLFNGNAYCAEELMAFTAGEYYFDIPSSHPFGIVMGSGYNVLSGTPSGDPMNVDGVTVQHYIGQLYVSLNGNAGETFSYHCQYHGYMGGKDRMVYDDQSCVGSAAGGPAPPPPPSTDENGCVTDSQFYCAEYQMCLSNGVPCLNKCLRNIDQGTNALAVVGGKYQFNGEAYKSYNSIAVTTGEYKISIPSSHPFGLIVDPSVINVISGTTYGSPTTKNGVSFQHYRGTLHFEVLADFGRGGYNCAFHGYMGGNNHLAYDDTCVGAVSPDPATPEPPSPSCDSGINICWDGSVVSRSLPDCLFVCPDQVEDEDDDFITCLTDVMECPGGETLGRDPSKDCAFPDCPDTTNTGSNSYVPVHTTETVSACGGTSGTPPVKDEGVSITSDILSNNNGCSGRIHQTRIVRFSNGDSHTVSIEDNTPPVISNIPDDKTVTYLTDTHKTGLASVQATDSCGGDVDITLSTSQSVNGGGYLLTKTWTAQDQCGNTASGQQAITASMGSQCMHSGSIVQHGWSGNSADHCKYYACNEGTLTTTQTICTTPTSISCLAPVAIPRDGHCCPTYRCAALVGVASHIVKINGDDTFEGDLHDCSKMHDRDMSSFYQLEPAVDGDLEIELDLGLVTNAINAYGIVFASPQFAYSTYNVFTSVDGVAWTLLHAEANGFCDDNISTKIRVDIAADGSDVRYIKFNVPNAVTDACHSSGIAKISDILIGIPDVSTFCDAGVTTCPTTECTGLGFTRTETLAANPAQGRCCPSYHCVQTFCASDTKLCWDGSTVTRDLADGCNFESCPSQVDCGTATTTCWDGSVVGKTTNDCIFECPVNPCDSLDCGANGECQPDTATCECEDAYEGTHCQMLKQPTPDLSHNTGSSFFAEQGVSCNTHTCYQMTDINEGWVEIIPGDLYTAGSRRLLLGDGEAYGDIKVVAILKGDPNSLAGYYTTEDGYVAKRNADGSFNGYKNIHDQVAYGKDSSMNPPMRTFKAHVNRDGRTSYDPHMKDVIVVGDIHFYPTSDGVAAYTGNHEQMRLMPFENVPPPTEIYTIDCKPRCPVECGEHGFCDLKLKQCICKDGFTGATCTVSP